MDSPVIHVSPDDVPCTTRTSPAAASQQPDLQRMARQLAAPVCCVPPAAEGCDLNLACDLQSATDIYDAGDSDSSRECAPPSHVRLSVPPPVAAGTPLHTVLARRREIQLRNSNGATGRALGTLSRSDVDLPVRVDAPVMRLGCWGRVLRQVLPRCCRPRARLPRASQDAEE